MNGETEVRIGEASQLITQPGGEVSRSHRHLLRPKHQAPWDFVQ